MLHYIRFSIVHAHVTVQFSLFVMLDVGCWMLIQSFYKALKVHKCKKSLISIAKWLLGNMIAL